MSETRFTPGPWRVANNGRSVLAGSVKINQSSGNGSAQSSEVAKHNQTMLEANANLMASSPELYDCLEFALEYMVEAEQDRKHWDRYPATKGYAHLQDLRNYINKATDALKKARGET